MAGVFGTAADASGGGAAKGRYDGAADDAGFGRFCGGHDASTLSAAADASAAVGASPMPMMDGRVEEEPAFSEYSFRTNGGTRKETKKFSLQGWTPEQIIYFIENAGKYLPDGITAEKWEEWKAGWTA